MKNRKIIICLTSLLALSLLITGCGKKIEVKNGSKVAVSTNKTKITATEYYNEIKKKNISLLIDMIDKDILEKDYPTDKEEKEEVKKQIDEIKSYVNNDEAQFKSLIQQYFGVDSEKELEESLKLEYKRTTAVKDYISKNVKDNEIEDYYNNNITGQIKASHILISIDAKEDATDEEKKEAEEKALKKAKSIIKKLDKGEKFSSLAKKYSTDEGTASKGGDLGYFQLNEMVSEFSNAVKELKKDEYTKEPVKTEYGYHIILKTGEKDKKKLKEKKEEIIEKIRDQKMQNDPTLLYKTLIEIRKDKKIKWNDSELKKAYEDYMDGLIEKASTSNNQTNG